MNFRLYGFLQFLKSYTLSFGFWNNSNRLLDDFWSLPLRFQVHNLFRAILAGIPSLLPLDMGDGVFSSENNGFGTQSPKCWGLFFESPSSMFSKTPIFQRLKWGNVWHLVTMESTQGNWTKHHRPKLRIIWPDCTPILLCCLAPLMSWDRFMAYTFANKVESSCTGVACWMRTPLLSAPEIFFIFINIHPKWRTRLDIGKHWSMIDECTFLAMPHWFMHFRYTVQAISDARPWSPGTSEKSCFPLSTWQVPASDNITR